MEVDSDDEIIITGHVLPPSTNSRPQTTIECGISNSTRFFKQDIVSNSAFAGPSSSPFRPKGPSTQQTLEFTITRPSSSPERPRKPGIPQTLDQTPRKRKAPTGGTIESRELKRIAVEDREVIVISDSEDENQVVQQRLTILESSALPTPPPSMSPRLSTNRALTRHDSPVFMDTDAPDSRHWISLDESDEDPTDANCCAEESIELLEQVTTTLIEKMKNIVIRPCQGLRLSTTDEAFCHQDGESTKSYLRSLQPCLENTGNGRRCRNEKLPRPLKLCHSFKCSGGVFIYDLFIFILFLKWSSLKSSAMTGVAQGKFGIAVSSSTNGGSTEEADVYDRAEAYFRPVITMPDDYNTPDALVTFTQKELQARPMNDHSATFVIGNDSEARNRTKFYTVQDVCFDSLESEFMFSAGEDRYVRRWKYQDGRFVPRGAKFFERRSPTTLAMHQSRSLLAVGCNDGTVHWTSQTSTNNFEIFSGLRVAPQTMDQSTGHVVWGIGPTTEQLFASSETKPQSTEDRVFNGYHKVFHVQHGAEEILFRGESGDNLSLSTNGDVVALISARRKDESQGADLNLRFFDPRMGYLQEIAAVAMSQFERQADKLVPETTAAVFSPDDRLFAVGREDDQIHIYDVRKIGALAAPMLRLRHGESCSTGNYGIARNMHWVSKQNGFGPELGLISGGGDGCVRLWDIRGACAGHEDSVVLTKLPYDIGALVVGQPGTGQWRLVVLSNSSFFFCSKN